MKWCKMGTTNLTVLEELRTKKGEKGLRRETEDEEKERTEESREKLRQSAPRNRGSEKDRVTEIGNQQRSKSVADGVTPDRQLETQA